ncbi:sugar transferase [Nocardioides korecus]
MTTFIPDQSEERRRVVGAVRAQTRLNALDRASTGLRLVPVIALLVDTVLLIAAVVLARVGRGGMGVFQDSNQVFNPTFLVAAPVVTLGWLVSIALNGGYERKLFGAGATEYQRVLNSGLLNAAVIGIGCFLFKFPLSRGWFVMVFALGMPLLLVGRWVLRRGIHRVRREGLLQHRVLVVGDGLHVDDVAEVLAREPWLGYDVIGALAPESASALTAGGVPILGPTTAVAHQAVALEADIVFFAGGAVESSSQLRQAIWSLEHTDISVVVAPSVTDVASERISVRPVAGMPMIHVGKPRSAAASRKLKRAFDVLGASALLLLFSPVFLYAGVCVKRHDGGPAFFSQPRVGRHGVTFRCLKFRTMVTNAEELLKELVSRRGTSSTLSLFKMVEDPRVTAPGRWLRRFSLDELPQLWNVLKGDMSLVGPRPPLQREVEMYDDDMARRLHVRPGLTGLWQVSGRSDLAIEEAIRLDLYYVDNWSMMQDLAILWRTLGAVVRGRGAY